MTDAPASARPRRFVALRNKHSRPYLFTAGLSMMGDNNEHVITYWVLWQEFHSAALVGFQVISHWLPFLLFSVWFGTLAEKYDCRKLIQISQGLFMFVSIMWGVLFLTDSLQMWQACILLVLHGMAGAMWGPAEQLMLHDFVERKDLPSAVRLNATFRSLGVLFGPAVGSALLLGLGPAWGILANVVFYLPMTLLMIRIPYTGHTRDGGVDRPKITLLDSVRVLRDVRANRLLVSMIILAGLAAITIGGSLNAAMPIFAGILGAGTAGTAYGVLLFANGAGGVIGGFLLEVTGAIKPNLTWAVIGSAAFGATTLVFATTHFYPLALIMLVIGGVANMASMSISQSIVQLEAPPGDRGRVFGVFGMFGSGLRTAGGITLSGLGTLIGTPPAIALCAAIFIVGAVGAGSYARSGGRRPAATG
ncbi:MFS transporter [Microlunatus soli]|uniref:MFS-type transporter involved in bile tolerance, Atg22 family n=1 Tax=Microlunatus soli TaxID=630515 RepID=A0A1H2A8R3_9ACTN|nr:MFS transporter [Microlunatus soli]SDT41866.1 MFS-type transporter involved in bile tolerance, Atg22 family [Microlunatus soli]